MFWFFGGKKEIEKVKEETKNSFGIVKKDINSLGEWIRHLNSCLKEQKIAVDGIKDDLSTVKIELEGIKNMFGFLESGLSKQAFKQVFKTQTAVYSKQTAVEGVQTGVQTAFQTAKIADFRNLFQNLSTVERAIVWVLMNSDMKLGYEDLAAILGKDRATIRGQINAIKRKSDGLIEELIEKNGKKRIYIPEKVRENILKSVKVRVNKQQKNKKYEEN